MQKLQQKIQKPTFLRKIFSILTICGSNNVLVCGILARLFIFEGEGEGVLEPPRWRLSSEWLRRETEGLGTDSRLSEKRISSDGARTGPPMKAHLYIWNWGRFSAGRAMARSNSLQAYKYSWSQLFVPVTPLAWLGTQEEESILWRNDPLWLRLGRLF